MNNLRNYIKNSKKEVKEKLKHIPVIDKLIRQRENREVDTFVISFPKCGRTWLRLMISRAIIQHFNLSISEYDQKLINIQYLSKLNSNIPKISFEHDDDAFFKSSDELCTSKSEYCYNKVLFLIRDPRDVLVSAFFHKKYRFNFLPEDKSKLAYASYDGEISQFIKEPTGSLKTLIKYYNIWEKNRHIPLDFMLLRYEDISSDPISSLRLTLDFLGLKFINDDIVAEAISYASFENMRNMEKNNLFNSPSLKPKNPSDYKTYKTRQGKVGGFKEHLDEESLLYVNNQIQKCLSNFYKYYY